MLNRADVITSNTALRHLVDRLKSESLLAVDTESNSLYAYYERVCLAQLSTRQRDYIVDPLALDDMTPLGELLADPQIEIVFHAAEYDVITLKRDFGFAFGNIFDTMVAARVCGWQQVGLGNILESEFDVRVNKKYQRADWSQRPIPDEQLGYAQMDTHYLPALRDSLLEELKRMGRLQEARELFATLPDLPAAEFSFDADGYWRIHHTRGFTRRQMAIAREVYLLRDEIARRLDRPVFKVFSDKALAEIARLGPRRLEDLDVIKGLGFRLIRQYGNAILAAVARGRAAPPPQPPRRPSRPPAPEVQDRYDALRLWRKERAAERGVESDVIVPRETLWALARLSPARVEDLDDIPGLGPWRREAYGAEMIAVLERANGAG